MGFTRSVGMSASEDRLAKLIQQRLAPGADKAAIDQRSWNLFGEEWCVMFTDLSGFSRGVAEFGIIHFLQVIYESHRLLIPIIENHEGILLKTEGDSLLVLFRRPGRALEAAVAMQQALHVYNVDVSDAEKVLLSVGLGFGRILRIGDADAFGAEVNAASKLGEDSAQPWEILVTEAVRSAGEAPAGLRFTPTGQEIPGGGLVYKVEYPRHATQLTRGAGAAGSPGPATIVPSRPKVLQRPPTARRPLP